MDGFGRVMDTTGLNAAGLMPLDGAPRTTYPTVSPRSMMNAVTRPMFHQGAVQNPPVAPINTFNASGGCIPICAAEITPPRTVNWIYLMHGHGGNMPLDMAAAATNPANVYVCFMVFSGASSIWAAQNMQSAYFDALDPGNVIPNANTLLIYGNHTSLVITRQAMIAVDIV